MVTRRQAHLFPGIQSRIVIPYVLIVLLIAGLGIFITTRLVASSLQERFTNQLVDSAAAASNQLVEIENNQLATLRLMAYTDGVARGVMERDAAVLRTLLLPIAANQGMEAVHVFDTAGYPLIAFESPQPMPRPSGAASSTLTHADLLALPIVSRILERSTDEQGDKFVQIDIPRRMMWMSAPITDASETLVGGLIVGVSLPSVVMQLGDQAFSDVILYGADGTLLVHTFGQDVEALRLDAPTFARLSEETQRASPLADIIVQGRSFQVLYTPLRVRQTTQGLLSVALPSNFIVERSSTSRDLFALLFFAMFASVILVGVFIARTITVPIARLVETTRAISGGDWSRRVQLGIPDELGELGNSFDAMTERLVAQHQQVNQLYRDQKQETARLDAVFSSISEALFVLDGEGGVRLRNRNAEALTTSLHPHPAAQQQMMTLLAQPQALETPRNVELHHRVFRVQASPITAADNEALGHVVAFQDITALIETERIKDDLVMQMSHELRTPLSVVRGYFDLIQMVDGNRLSDQGLGFSALVTENLTILERMINEVIDVSAVVSNHFHLNVGPVDLNSLLETHVAEWEATMETRELTISLHTPTTPIRLPADDERLGQVIDHLLRNAYSYSLPGGHVTVTAEAKGRHVLIIVSDQGVGIGEDEVEKVFERMFRGRSAAAGPTDARGLGLGLYLSKHIIEAHRGSIHLESALNTGTTVTIRLPATERPA